MLRPLLIAATLALPHLAQAHEFWIEPLKWQVEPGAVAAADIRVGQMMKGSALSYIPKNIRRFEVATPAGIFAIERTIGDRPVLNNPTGDPGLYVVIHATSDSTLTYGEFEKFEAFVTHKDLGDTLAQHDARGLPRVGFGERYSRYAKSLIAVGDGRGTDREVGLLTEITALANPYTDDVSGGMPVRLTYQGEPRADEQIEVFERDTGGEVTVTTLRTDGDGRALIPVKPGHDYMLDAVLMRAVEPAFEGDPVWESLWANLTFGVPG